MKILARLALLSFFIVSCVKCVRHNISLTNDDRKNFPLSTFGFYKGGRLIIDMKKFVPPPKVGKEPYVFGFSLQSTKNDGVSSYMEKGTSQDVDVKYQEKGSRRCVLTDPSIIDSQSDMKIILFKFNIDMYNTSNANSLVEKGYLKTLMPNFRIDIVRHGAKENDTFFTQLSIQSLYNETIIKTTLFDWLNSHKAILSRPEECDSKSLKDRFTDELPLRFSPKAGKEKAFFSSKIEVNISCAEQEGLYSLYFHNCINYKRPGSLPIDIDINMIEHNKNNFLSAGELPLPIVYGFMSFSFFGSAFIWTLYLHINRKWTYKIHWLMAVVVYIKSLSVAFHALSYYYIGKGGLHVTTWAVLFYIIHLLKGALLFTAIIFIGTGYFFVKHVFSSKEKKLFMIIIPLQVILNVINIINESTEEGAKMYKFWSQAFVLIDLLCCGAILLPVVWSIKHLSEAAKTDGKAAISLQKLKLFRQFYVMVVCYIYFTRIIVYLIKEKGVPQNVDVKVQITVPFQYVWLDEFFTEVATYFFYVLTGYKFRPMNDNPYLHLPQDDDDNDEEEADIEMNDMKKVLHKTLTSKIRSVHPSYGEGLTRVNKADTLTRKT